MIDAVVLDVLADQVHAHLGMLDRQAAEGRADLGVDVVHLRVALLDLHQHVVPGEVAGRRVVEAVLLELRLAGAVLDGGVVDDEGQVGMVERRLLDVGGVGQVAQRRATATA